MGHATAPGNRYGGQLNQDYAVGRPATAAGRQQELARTKTATGAKVLQNAPQPLRSCHTPALPCPLPVCVNPQVVQQAFNLEELNSQDLWQQCCVAAVLDGALVWFSQTACSLHPALPGHHPPRTTAFCLHNSTNRPWHAG